MLKFENVTFQYKEDKEPMLEGLSFEVKRGEFVSVIGPSGCGKSTIFKLTAKLLAVQEGSIIVNGESIEKQSGYLGYMPQSDLLFPWRTVSDNVMLPLEIKGGVSREEMKRLATETLEKVGLKDKGDKMPGELSGGMRQRAAFARTMLTGSEIMLLDEPFSALDYLTRISMREWLLEQYEREKKTILFITHDVEEALFLSDRILVITETPISSLESFEVPLGHPRSLRDLTRPEIVDLKDKLIDMLRRDDI